MTARLETRPITLSRRTALGRAATLAATLGLGGRLHRVAAEGATPGPAATPALEGQTISIDGADLYYVVRGDEAGEPVLLLHAGLGSTEDWDGVSPALVAAGYRVIAMDSRAQGRSSWGDAPLTYEVMAADVLGVLDHLGIAQTHLIGWSDGGIIGLELAINQRERLRKLVANAVNFTPEGVHPPAPSAALAAQDAVGREMYMRLSPHPERYHEVIVALNQLWAVAPNFSEEQLAGITTPVLVLDGAEEEFIYPEHTERLAELIPGAELVFMPDTGLFALIEQPEEFSRIGLDFLAS